MAIEKRMCASHPGRLAIGVCVETKSPICGECSTRYEGVNYSKEGLRIMQARRAAKIATGGPGWLRRNVSAMVFSGLALGCVYVLFVGYDATFVGMTDLLHRQDGDTTEALNNLLKMLGQ